jgi:Anti-sigma-K factor rskA
VRVDHERVQELLAGFALHALDPEQLREAEGLRATHLPGCDECRKALATFEAAAGEMGLAAGSKAPPRLLQRRLRRDLAGGHRSRRWVAYLPAAAGVVVAGGLLLWNAQLTSRIGHAEQREAASAELLTAVSHPASKVLPLPLHGVHVATSGTPAQLAAATIPGRAVLYVFGSMPTPTGGHVYTVWLSHSGHYVSVAVFVPDRGSVLLAVRINPFGYERLLITEEEGKGRGSPSPNHLTEISL